MNTRNFKLGAAIRAARVAKGLTQSQLAELLGPDDLGRASSAVTVSRWENGSQAPERRMRAILAALDSVELLLVYGENKR